ncbi:ABC transporter substrate-binding protein [Paenibacillus hamazuiensis]|uniref:ABC transporter substrate-binding protein n=1 Tax=Paenibacillus hamazuiensis TaxID=2936508 RepID=UPI00200FFAEC|nr:extracellular solute-binding protein [Paenibacillus hamazuiensis]
MFKSIGVVAALTLAASALLSGCGGGPAEPGTAADKSSAKNAGPVTINWWSWNPDENKAKTYVDAFNASQSDIKVNYKRYEFTDYVKTLKLAMISGDEVDLFGLQAGGMIKEYAEFTEDLTPYAKKEWGENWKNRFFDLGLKQLISGDKTPALPWFVSAAGYLFYNNTIMEKEGLKPPSTYAEWIEVSKALQTRGVTPYIQGGKDAWQNLDMFIALANEFDPGKIYAAEEGKAKWTEAGLVKAATVWKEMFENGIMQKGALGIGFYPDAYDKFNKGEAAMTLLGTWNDNRMTKTILQTHRQKYGVTVDYEFIAAPFPDMNGDGKPGRLFGGPDVALAINKNSKKKDAAWKFMQWLESADGQKINAKYLMIPAIKGVDIEDSDVLTDRQKDNIKQQMKDLENSIGRRELIYPEIKTALGDALQMIATGKTSPEEGMKTVQAAADKVSR